MASSTTASIVCMSVTLAWVIAPTSYGNLCSYLLPALHGPPHRPLTAPATAAVCIHARQLRLNPEVSLAAASTSHHPVPARPITDTVSPPPRTPSAYCPCCTPLATPDCTGHADRPRPIPPAPIPPAPIPPAPWNSTGPADRPRPTPPAPTSAPPSTRRHRRRHRSSAWGRPGLAVTSLTRTSHLSIMRGLLD